MAYSPLPGFEWNPLRPYRNAACLCGSGRKIKKCHGMSQTLPTAEANIARAYLRDLSAAGVITVRPSEITPTVARISVAEDLASAAGEVGGSTPPGPPNSDDPNG